MWLFQFLLGGIFNSETKAGDLYAARQKQGFIIFEYRTL